MSSPKEEHRFTKKAIIQVKNSDFNKQWEELISKTRQMLSAEEYGKSMSYFAYVVHHAPQFKPEIQEDFLFALKNWCNILKENNKTEDIVNCLNEARKLFPDFAEISNYVGSMLFRLHMFDEAAVYFRHALTLDPGLFNAQEGLDSVANLLVERWHFRMLNDEVRNQAYKNAIHRAVTSGCMSVLDIGSGSGILSMYAVESGANEVFACETSKTMFDLSADILQVNSMQGCIHVINKSSYDLEIPKDLPKRVSLVVTETLDCGLLGEGILQILTHAKKHLTKLPGLSDEMPASNSMVEEALCGDGATKLSNNVTSLSSDNDVLPYNEVATNGNEKKSNNPKTDEIALDKDIPFENGTTVHKVDTHKVVTKIIPEGATVYGQIVQCEKIRRYARVHETTLGLDLSSVNIKGAEISEKCQEPYTTEDMSYVTHTPLSEPFRVTTYDFRTPQIYTEESHTKINIPVTHSGAIDAVVTWFELKLDEYETISSAPGCSICWEQAVYPSGSLINVKVNDEVILDCKSTDKAIYIAINNVIKQGSVMNAENKTTLDTDFVLPFSEVSKLNDNLFNQCYQSGIQEAYDEISLVQRNPKSTGCLLLCDSPTFNPLFAVSAGFTTTLCRSEKESFNDCLEILRRDNALPNSLQFTKCNLEGLCGSGEWNLLVIDPVETSGILRQEVVQDVVFAKGCILVKDNAIVLPRKVEVWGMLIASHSLCLKSRVVNNDVTLGLDIAGHMNQFAVKNQVDVDVTSNPYVAMSEPTRLLTLDFTSSNDDDSLLGLLNQAQDTEVTATKEGRVDGLMYWFVLEFTKERRLSTGPQDCSHFNQVVIVFEDILKVLCDERLSVRTSCKDSCITATVSRYWQHKVEDKRS